MSSDSTARVDIATVSALWVRIRDLSADRNCLMQAASDTLEAFAVMEFYEAAKVGAALAPLRAALAREDPR